MDVPSIRAVLLEIAVGLRKKAEQSTVHIGMGEVWEAEFDAQRAWHAELASLVFAATHLVTTYPDPAAVLDRLDRLALRDLERLALGPVRLRGEADLAVQPLAADPSVAEPERLAASRPEQTADAQQTPERAAEE